MSKHTGCLLPPLPCLLQRTSLESSTMNTAVLKKVHYLLLQSLIQNKSRLDQQQTILRNISYVYSVLLQYSGRVQTLKCFPAVLFSWLTREMQKSYLKFLGSEVQMLQDPGSFPPEVVLFAWMHLVHVLSFQGLQSKESRKFHSMFHTQQLLLRVTQKTINLITSSTWKLFGFQTVSPWLAKCKVPIIHRICFIWENLKCWFNLG